MTEGGTSEFPLEGELQPPMANGEVLFEEPWQGRIFAMTILLHQDGLFSWQEFQDELIEVIGQWDAVNDETRQYEYYEHFSVALKTLLDKKDLVASGELSRRIDEYASRPHGHDH